jgi:hypothetical protein
MRYAVVCCTVIQISDLSFLGLFPNNYVVLVTELNVVIFQGVQHCLLYAECTHRHMPSISYIMHRNMDPWKLLWTYYIRNIKLPVVLHIKYITVVNLIMHFGDLVHIYIFACWISSSGGLWVAQACLCHYYLYYWHGTILSYIARIPCKLKVASDVISCMCLNLCHSEKLSFGNNCYEFILCALQ